jgi:hypothetical protein
VSVPFYDRIVSDHGAGVHNAVFIHANARIEKRIREHNRAGADPGKS